MHSRKFRVNTRILSVSSDLFEEQQLDEAGRPEELQKAHVEATRVHQLVDQKETYH